MQSLLDKNPKGPKTTNTCCYLPGSTHAFCLFIVLQEPESRFASLEFLVSHLQALGKSRWKS